MRLTKSGSIIMAAVLLCFTQSVDAGTNTERYYAKKGIYAGLLVPYNSFSGDFDGNSLLVSQSAAFILPQFDSKLVGLGIAFGYGAAISNAVGYAVEASYTRSAHDITWVGVKGNAVYQSLNFDGRFFFLADKPFQLYAIVGFGWPDWVVVKNGSARVNNAGVVTLSGDAKFSGVSAKIGGGIAFYINRRLSLSGGLAYRVREYNTVKEVNGNRSIHFGEMEEKLSGNGLTLDVALRVAF
jgi:hypothetical protein